MLGLIVAEHVFAVQPELSEGSMAKIRAAVVSAPTLAEVAVALGLGSDVLLGKGEDASGGRTKPSILADAMEAVIGAVHLDGGIVAARLVVMGQLAGRIAAEVSDGPGGADHKTHLQELAAHRFDELPAYRLSDEGPDHEKRFRAEVSLGAATVGAGEGRSKKLAEQAAAKVALAVLTDDDGSPSDVRPDPAGVPPPTTSESEQGHA